MKTISGAELFAVGEWNGMKFSLQDLQGIAASFDAMSLSGKVPLKLGHSGPDARENPLSQFALGWVKKVWVAGDRLLADLDVADKAYEWVNQGFLRHVSVELLKNVRADTRTIPWVLDAVAVLGSDQPAVGVLQALMQRGQARMTGESRLAFTRESSTSSEKPKMTEQEIAAMQAENARLKREKDEQRQEFERKESERIKTEGNARRDKAIAAFDKAVKEDLIVPATKENFLRNAAPPEGDSRWASFDHDLVQKCIDDNPKSGAKKFSRTQGKGGEGGNADDAAMEGMDASQKLAFKVNRQLEKSGGDPGDQAAYDAAVRAVFQSNPELAKSYRGFACGDEAA